jgi:sodium/bile acid cotransporter 7
MFVAWNMLKFMFPNDPKLRVMGLYGCTHKTVAMGVPLINAIYEDNPAVGLYTLPLLIWHPMQLVIGTFLSPRLAAFVEREEERLGLNEVSEEEQADEPAAPEEKV